MTTDFDIDVDSVIAIPGCISISIRQLLDSHQRTYEFFSSLFSNTPLAWQSGTQQRQKQRQQWSLLLPCVLLWPLIRQHAYSRRSKSSRRSVVPEDGAEKAHTYAINISCIDSRMESEKFVRITPFNPLASVRRSSQQSRGDGTIANMSVSLSVLLTDCDDMPAGWKKRMEEFCKSSD